LSSFEEKQKRECRIFRLSCIPLVR